MTNQQLTNLLHAFRLAREMLVLCAQPQDIRDGFDAKNDLFDALRPVGAFELLKDGQVIATVPSMDTIPELTPDVDWSDAFGAGAARAVALVSALLRADEIRVKDKSG